MSSKRNFINLIGYMAYRAVFISIFSLLSVAAFAEDNYYQFNKIAHLNHSEGEPSQWLQLVTHPNNIQQYFVINKTGQMYLVDNMQNPHPVLDLNANNLKESSSIKLTSIELHPNFALKGQLGYRVFYTAHLEVLDEKSRTKRLQERSDELILKFDAVITEWKFSSDDYQKVDLSTKREILRIAVPDHTMTIKQMSFSPYAKSWNDNFGLLYIALNGQENWQKPLYSGVLLRINPAKFGLRSFTIPNDNPYLKESKIKDEIYLLGGQNIKQFIWPNKNNENILLSHHHNDNHLLSLTNGQNDWRNGAPKQMIYQSDKAIEYVLLYRGSNLSYLRNKLLLLRQKNQKWFIESLAVTPSVYDNTLKENKPQQEWQLPSQQLTSSSEVTFSINRDGEVLILDKTAGMIFQMYQNSSGDNTLVEEQVTTSEIQTSSTNSLYIVFILMTAIGVVFYFFKRNKFSAKAVVRKQFAHIELSESELQIGLYQRHQSSTDTIIDIVDITNCKVKLNNQTINVINQKAGHGFNDAKEQDLRNILTKEQVDKMVDGKVRQVNLLITDINEKYYTVCLYMRKGSDRVTKKTYSVVIDDLVNWCWLIATKVNPDETGNRKKKPAIPSESSIDLAEQRQNQKPLHDQAAAIRSITHDALKTPHGEELELTNEQSVTQEDKEDVNLAEPLEQNNVNSNTIDTELVDALEKLVNLKQEGFLTQEEFTKAKENLMRSLFEKSKK